MRVAESLAADQVDELLNAFSALPGKLQNLGYALDHLLASLLPLHTQKVLAFARTLAFLERLPDNGLFRLPLLTMELLRNTNNSLGTALTMWLSSKDIRDVRLAMAFEDPRICRLKYGRVPYSGLEIDKRCLGADGRDHALVRIVYRALGTYSMEHVLAVRMTLSCLELMDGRTREQLEDVLYEALCINHVFELRRQLDAMSESADVRRFLEPLWSRAQALLRTVKEASPCRELAVGTHERAVAFKRNRRLFQRAHNEAMKESLTVFLFGEPKRMLYGDGAVVPLKTPTGETFQEYPFEHGGQQPNFEIPALMATHGMRMNMNGTLWRIQKEFVV